MESLGCPPVVAEPTEVKVDGGICRVSGKTSSQFLSALLLRFTTLASENETFGDPDH